MEECTLIEHFCGTNDKITLQRKCLLLNLPDKLTPATLYKYLFFLVIGTTVFTWEYLYWVSYQNIIHDALVLTNPKPFYNFQRPFVTTCTKNNKFLSFQGSFVAPQPHVPSEEVWLLDYFFIKNAYSPFCDVVSFRNVQIYKIDFLYTLRSHTTTFWLILNLRIWI